MTTVANPSSETQTLPQHGLVRFNELIRFVPLGRTTIYKWIKLGKFPKPMKLSPTVSAWRCEDIHAWLQQQTVATQTPPNNPTHPACSTHT